MLNQTAGRTQLWWFDQPNKGGPLLLLKHSTQLNKTVLFKGHQKYRKIVWIGVAQLQSMQMTKGNYVRHTLSMSAPRFWQLVGFNFCWGFTIMTLTHLLSALQDYFEQISTQIRHFQAMSSSLVFVVRIRNVHLLAICLFWRKLKFTVSGATQRTILAPRLPILQETEGFGFFSQFLSFMMFKFVFLPLNLISSQSVHFGWLQ